MPLVSHEIVTIGKRLKMWANERTIIKLDIGFMAWSGYIWKSSFFGWLSRFMLYVCRSQRRITFFSRVLPLNVCWLLPDRIRSEMKMPCFCYLLMLVNTLNAHLEISFSLAAEAEIFPCVHIWLSQRCNSLWCVDGIYKKNKY